MKDFTPEKLKHHILITGTGRTGTTFLVQLLTMLGIDTGFTKDYLPVNKLQKAGLEYQGLGGNLPYVIKNPKLMWQLPKLIEKHPAVIDHVLIPMRNLDAAIESRLKNLQQATQEINPCDVVGGLEGVDEIEKQGSFFLEKLHSFLVFVSAYQIPVTFLQYPRLVLDSDYLYHKVGGLFKGITKEQFLHTFADIADISLVHKYCEQDICHLVYDDTQNVHQLSDSPDWNNAEVTQLRPQLQQLRKDYLLGHKQQQELLHENNLLHQQNTEHLNQLEVSKGQIQQFQDTVAQQDKTRIDKDAVIAEKDRLKATLKQDLLLKDNMISEKDRLLTDADVVIAEKGQRVTDLKDELGRRERTLSDAKDMIVEKDRMIEGLKDANSQKETVIAEKERAIENANTDVANLQAAVAENEQALSDANTVITENDSAIWALKEAVSQKDNIIAEKDQALADANTVIAKKEQTIVAKDETISQKDVVISKKNQALENVNADIASLQTIAAEKDSAIADKDRQIRGYRQELYSVYTSKSWRFTLPMRKVGTLARRIVSIPHRPWFRAKIKRVYFLLPALVRNSRLIEILKNRFKNKEIL